MSIPLPTTTIAVLVPDADADPYEDRTLTQVATGVPAHFSTPRGYNDINGGTQENVDMQLVCDPCELPYTATIRDLTTDERWSVVWVRERSDLEGLAHMVVGVNRVQGVVPS